jgi:quinol monooxygenase YgiN
MPFVQIVSFSTSRFDEMKALSDKYEADTAGKRTSTKATICADRDTPGRFVIVAEFPSFEAAMENSNLPETQALAEEMRKLADGPASYMNLDVIDVVS